MSSHRVHRRLMIEELEPRIAPTSFDLRLSNDVTDVRSMGAASNTGWAFATYGSLESSVLVEGGPARDLSENHLKNYHGFDYGWNSGGNSYMSEAYLSRWRGPVDETADPFNDLAGPPSPGGPAQYYVREMLRFDTPTEIKNAISAGGGVYSNMYYDSAYYTGSDFTYYYGQSAVNSNHAVTLIGWDDAKVTAATSAGAWLAKNSQGPTWGNQGYFWISYSDTVACKFAEAFRDAAPASAYSSIYDYSEFGDVGQLNAAYGFNAYTPTKDQYLSAVGFFTEADNATYNLRIYDTFTGGALGAQLSTKSGTATYAGYHTVDLSSPVPVKSGDMFYVYVNITTGGMSYDYKKTGYSSAATAGAGQSYYSTNGSTWIDLTGGGGDYATANLNLKVLAMDSLPKVTIEATDPAGSETGPDPAQFTVFRTGPITSAVTVGYTISGAALNGTDYNGTGGVPLTTSVVIPAGSATAGIPIYPVNDTIPESAETVILTLTTSGDYVVGTQGSATAYIMDNEPGATALWTYLVYMNGDGAQEDAALADFVEMSSVSGLVGLGSPVRVLVQFDRIGSNPTFGGWADTKRFEITTAVTPDPANAITSGWPSGTEVNMADPSSLTNFINWGIGYAPATHYAVVLWDHGSAWPQVCYDQTSNNYLTTQEVRTGLEGVVSVDVLAFDAGLTAMTELAYEVRAEASVLVAPQQSVPFSGYPYNTILAQMLTNPAMTAAQVGATIVTKYGASYPSTPVAMSAIDLSKVNSLGDAVSNFADAVISRNTDWGVIYESRMNAGYYYGSPQYRDLKGLMSGVAIGASDATIKSAAQAVVDIFNSGLVISNYSSALLKGNGLSIYFTERGYFSDGESVDPNYNATNFLFVAKRWDEFLPPYLNANVISPGLKVFGNITDVPILDDGTTVTSSIAVTDTSPIADLNVQVNIQHGRDSDLNVYLVAPDATVVELFSAVGGTGVNFTDTILDDEVSAQINLAPAGLMPYATHYRPEGLLSDMKGKALNGTWTLRISDTAPGVTGTLLSWSIVASPPVTSSVTIAVTDGTASEVGPDTGQFTITRTGGTTAALTVSYTIAGTATNGSDYTDSSGYALPSSIVIPAGVASANILIIPVQDPEYDPNETVILTLAAGAYTIGAASSGSITIGDDPTVTIVATDVTAAEAGLDPGVYTFTRTGPTTSALSVGFAIGGNATNSADYTDTNGNPIASPIVIPAGQSSATLTVRPVDDTIAEPGETIVLTLSASANYVIGTSGAAIVTIADDDGSAPTSVDLVAASDTGLSSTDDTTNRDNSAPGATLQFFVTGVLSGATVTLYADVGPDGTAGFTIGAGTAGATTITVSTDGVTDLLDGEHVITARQTTLGSPESFDSPPLMITVDTLAPDPPDIPDLDDAGDTGLSNTDNITSVNRPVLNLSGFESYYRLYRSGTRISTDYATSAIFTEPSALPNNTYLYTLYAVDVAGNLSASSSGLSVVVDTQAPATPSLPDLIAAADTGLSNSDNITNVTMPVLALSGFGSYYRLFRGATQITDDYATSAGFAEASPLADGTYDYRLNAVDAAGNVSPVSTLTITIDTTGPSAANLPDLTPDSDTGISNTDNITSVKLPLLSLSGFGSYYRLYRGATQVSGDFATVGIYGEGGSLADGSYTYTLYAVDAVGNLSPPAGLTITVDSTPSAPPNPPDLVAAADSGVSNTDNLTKINTPTLALTGFSEFCRLYRGATEITGDYAVLTSFTEPAPLADGSFTYRLYAVDAAGNVSAASNLLSITVDTQAPAPPSAPDLTPGSDTGVSNTDNVTAQTHPVFNLAGLESYYRLYRGATQVSADYASAPTFTEALTLGDGTYSYSLYAVDAAGNVGSGTALTLTIDTVPPGPANAPKLESSSDMGVSSTDGITNINKPVIRLSGFQPYYRLTRDGALIGSDWATAVKYPEPLPLADDTYTYSIIAVDIAGNTSAPAACTVVVDTQAPAPPPAPDLEAASDTGASATDNLTKDTTPALDVATTDAYYRLYRDGVRISDLYATSPTFIESPLTDDSYVYASIAVDTAGNESAPSAPLSITVDTQGPRVTSYTPGGYLDQLPSQLLFDFSEPMDWGTLSASDIVFIGPHGATPTTNFGGVTPQRMQVTINEALPGRYLITLGPQIGDAAGNAMDQNNNFVNAVSPADAFVGSFALNPHKVWELADGQVILYDTDALSAATSDIARTDVQVKTNKDGSVNTVAIVGNPTGLGILVNSTGGAPVIFNDSRTAASLRSISFIANDGGVTQISLKSGLAGYYIGHLVMVNLGGTEDLDGDGLIDDATALYSTGPVGSLKVAGSIQGDVVVKGADSTGLGIGPFAVTKGGISGDVVALDGGLKSLTVAGGLTGRVLANGAAGIGPMSFTGDLLGATISAPNAASGIKSLTARSAAGSSVAAGAAGIGSLSFSGNVNGLSVRTTGNLGAFSITGSPLVARSLSAMFDVKVFGSLNAASANADHLIVRATDRIGPVNLRMMNASVLSAGSVGSVTVARDLLGSKILAGYDIGSDLAFGTGDDGVLTGSRAGVGAVNVGGSMAGASISAGILPGADGQFGTADDVGMTWMGLAGTIDALTVKFSCVGSPNSAESYGVLAHGMIGKYSLGGKTVPLPWLYGNIRTVQNWR